MNQNQFVHREFYEYFNENSTSVADEISYKNYTLETKGMIVYALVLWKYLREVSVNAVNYRQIIQGAMETLSDTGLTKLVLMIEYLPVTVWRKLLWKENIDFMSYESFLRRLTPNQAQAISNNYNDIREGLIPRVMKKSLRDRVKIFFGHITLEGLMSESTDRSLRSTSKSAWAFNLLGIDFGFGLYPNGINDDYKITNKKFTRFLSIKNHINDFVVNQEDGKYWFMYKSARSNIAFRPKQNVKLQNHICPGFWWTLFVHLDFWILSPVGFVLMLLLLPDLHGNISLAIVLFAISSLTPLWILLLTFRGIVHVFKKVFPKLQGPLNTVAKWIAVCFVIAIVGCVTFAFYSVCMLFSFFLGLGVITAFLVPTVLLAYLISTFKDEGVKLYSKYPEWVKFLLGAILVGVGIQLTDKIAPIVWNVLALAGKWIFGFCLESPMLALWSAVSLAIIVLVTRLNFVSLNNEVKFAKQSTVLLKVFMLWFIVTVITTVVEVFKMGSFPLSNIPLPLVVILSVAFVTFIVALWRQGKINSNTINSRLMSGQLVDLVNMHIVTKWYKLDRLDFLRNEWLMSMSAESAERRVQSAIDTLTAYLPISIREIGFEIVLKHINKRILKEIRKIDRTFLRDLADKDRIEVLSLIVKGYSYQEAFATVVQLRSEFREKKWKEEQAKVARQNFFYQLFTPFRFIREKVSQFFGTLQDLWSLFNERCPYVSRSKQLD